MFNRLGFAQPVQTDLIWKLKMTNGRMIDPHTNPFAGMDVRTFLEGQATRLADKPCLNWEPLDGEAKAYSYSAFVERVSRVAAGLHTRGIRSGDKVIVHMENCPEQLFSWLGCAWIGAVAVTTNAKSSRAELAYFAEKSKARAAITQPSFKDLLSEAMPSAEWIAITGEQDGSDESIIPFSALDDGPQNLPPAKADPTAPFGIQFTSGTTSRPKGVVWTHANVLWGGKVSASHEDLREDDIHLVYLPLFHTNAQIYSVMASLWVGATIVLQPRFSASRFWPVALKHKCTWTSMVPFVVHALLQHPVPDVHHFRFWANGACDIPTDPHFRVRTIGWWGMTETVTHGIVGSTSHPDRPMSMGRAATEYEIAIVDENGRPVQPGETGDLLVRGIRGLSLFLEYLDDPVSTEATFNDDGWLITGDRATAEKDGWLVFADRSKDMLKVGGENVAASEVERVISELPGVREVAVVGKPHPMLQEAPVAFVRMWVPADSVSPDFAKEAIAACEAELASFKVPHDVYVVDDFPRATLGKIAKAELRQRLS